MKAEADALGDTSLIAEMAAMEHQLQVICPERRSLLLPSHEISPLVSASVLLTG